MEHVWRFLPLESWRMSTPVKRHTERILFETGVIRALGSVDKGTTQTDTLALERARGITIKAAVAAFPLGDFEVDLIDTPGHADFIAEVERSLRVLDAVVLVVSAVEGVQPQTRALRGVPRGRPATAYLHQQIDRMGARPDDVLDDLRRKLGLHLVPVNHAFDTGEAEARVAPIDRNDSAWREPVTDLLAELDDRVIEAFEQSARPRTRRVLHGRRCANRLGRGRSCRSLLGRRAPGPG